MELSASARDNIDDTDNGSKKAAFAIINKVMENDALIQHVVSFCDFHSAITIGMTCKRFKTISDGYLDRVVADIVNNKGSYETTACAGSRFKKVKLRLSCQHAIEGTCITDTHTALIQEGIELCNPMPQDHFHPGHVNFFEEKARYLLHTREYAEIEDFLTPAGYNDFFTPAGYPNDERFYNDFGWSVKAKLQTNLDLQAVAMEIMHPGWEDNTKYWRDEDYEEALLIGKDFDYESKRCTIQFHSLCLLRKADPSSFQRKFLNLDTRITEFPQDKYRSWISFRVLSSSLATTNNCDGHNDNTDNYKGGSTQFEFYYSTKTVQWF